MDEPTTVVSGWFRVVTKITISMMADSPRRAKEKQFDFLSL
jgi:hypothetical protein